VKRSKISLKKIKEKIKQFVKERDWEQYHSPKNLSMSVAIEAAELMEHFQWLTTEQSKELLKNKKKRSEIQDELADIAIFIFDFCNIFNINLERIIMVKLRKNRKKYPIKLSKGKSNKYTEI